MLAKMIDKIVSLKETKIFEINGQTYADASLTRIPPHVDRPDCISVSGLDSICKLIRTELEKVGTTIMVQVKSNDTVEVMTTYLSDFSRNTLYRAKADAPGLRTGFRGREVALIELRSLCIPNEGTAYLLDLLSRMTNEFLSTPSARRATLTEASGSSRPRNFYPRPPRGGRPGRVRAFQQHPRISIHALREEGDSPAPGMSCTQHNFYPRPPRGGRPDPL